jgi:hypothetical protein
VGPGDDALFADLPEHQRALVATSRANIPAAPRAIPPRLVAGEGPLAAQKRIGVVVAALFAVFTMWFAYAAEMPWLAIFALLAAVAAVRLHFDAWFRLRQYAWVRDGVGAVARVTSIEEIANSDSASVTGPEPDAPRVWRVSYRYVLDGRESGDAQRIGAEEKAILERAGIVPIIVDRASTKTVPYFSALDLR